MSYTSNLTRRSFLTTATAAVAAPLILPKRVFGANDRINIAYIGAGRRGGQLQGIPEEAQFVAVADVNIRRAQDWARRGFGEKYGLSKDDAYQDYKEMLERKDVDAVIVASPDHWHALHAVHAMRAGKDVYVEKPMTLTIKEGRVMVDEARKHKRICQVGSQQRSMRANRIGCALVRAGRIGKVHTVHAALFPTSWDCDLPEEEAPDYIDWDMWCGQTQPRGFHEKLYPPRGGKMGHEWGWISFRPYSGGEVTGWGAHGFDQIQWALNKDHTTPVKITPLLDKKPKFDGIHKGPSCQVEMVYEDGTVMKVDGRAGGGGGWFEGEDGQIKIDRGKYQCRPDTLDDKLPELPEIKVEGDTDAHIANWCDSIRTRELSNADVEIGHRTTTVCHLVNIARWVGRELNWDPKTETFPGDAEANSYIEREMRAPYNFEA